MRYKSKISKRYLLGARQEDSIGYKDMREKTWGVDMSERDMKIYLWTIRRPGDST